MNFRKILLGLSMLVFLISSMAVYASGGTLKISLGENADSVKVFVYHIAEIEDGEIVLLEEFDGLEAELMNFNSARRSILAAEEVYEWVQENDIPAAEQGKTESDGEVEFVLDSGVYLIASDNVQGVLQPLLITMEGDSVVIYPKFSKPSSTPQVTPEETKEPIPEETPETTPEDNPNETPEATKEPTLDKTQDGDGGDNPGETPEPDKPKEETNQTILATGDTSGIILWAVLLAAAFAGIIFFAKKRKS